MEDLRAEADKVGYEIALGTLTRTHNERRALDMLLEFRCKADLLLGPELTAGSGSATARSCTSTAGTGPVRVPRRRG